MTRFLARHRSQTAAQPIRLWTREMSSGNSEIFYDTIWNLLWKVEQKDSHVDFERSLQCQALTCVIIAVGQSDVQNTDNIYLSTYTNDMSL